MESAVILVLIGVYLFLLFGVKDCVNIIADAGVKKAEAVARAEEARAERAKTELELARLEHNKTLT